MPDLPLIVFDVNETLLDLETMAPVFERIFQDKAAMRLWFAQSDPVFRFPYRCPAICAVHRYRCGCHENAGGYARDQNHRQRQEGTDGQVLDNAAASGCACSP